MTLVLFCIWFNANAFYMVTSCEQIRLMTYCSILLLILWPYAPFSVYLSTSDKSLFPGKTQFNTAHISTIQLSKWMCWWLIILKLESVIVKLPRLLQQQRNDFKQQYFHPRKSFHIIARAIEQQSMYCTFTTMLDTTPFHKQNKNNTKCDGGEQGRCFPQCGFQFCFLGWWTIFWMVENIWMKGNVCLNFFYQNV